MVHTYSISIFLIVTLSMTTITSARYLQLQGSDERDKRQIGDLKTAEYLALITLSQMHRLPEHCAELACGLVDVLARLSKRTMSDQRLAELQALIALSKGQGVPIGHGLIDPWAITVQKGDNATSDMEPMTGTEQKSGKRRKRSIGSLFGSLNKDQKMRVINRLVTRNDDNSEVTMS